MSSVPYFDAGYVTIIYICLPWIPITAAVVSASRQYKWRGGKVYKYLCNLAVLLYRYAPYVSLSLLCWTILLMIHQGAFIYARLSISFEYSYYSLVDLPSFTVLNAIAASTATNSYAAVLSATDTNLNFNRRLQITSVDSTVTLAYHRREWKEDMLTEHNLIAACETELSILNNPGCLSTRNYQSFFKDIFQSDSCVFKENYQTALQRATYTDNSLFVTDFIEYDDPQSKVILSYFSLNDCSDLSSQEFSNFINTYSVNDTRIIYTSLKLNDKAFEKSAYSGLNAVVGGLIPCFIILVIGLGGLMVPIMTMFCLFISYINGAALTAYLGYRFFSILNVASMLITAAYGCCGILMYASQWRFQVKRGSDPTIPGIMNAYITFGQIMLYITIIACMTCFVLRNSSVIIVQQFGVFTAFSILSFFLFMHYLLIPFFIFASWFRIPPRYHKYVKSLKRTACCLCMYIDQMGMGEIFSLTGFLGGNDDEDEEMKQNEDSNRVEDVRDHIDGDVGDDEHTVNNQSRTGNSHSEGTLTIQGNHVLGRDDNSSSGSPAARRREAARQNDTQFRELEQDTTMCRGKRPLKFIGFLSLLLVLIGLGIVYILSVNKISFDFSIPRAYKPSSNFGKQLHVMESYKNDLFISHRNPFRSSNVPTAAPVASPPTRAPTHRPTSSVAIAPIIYEQNHVDYKVKTCWGITGYKSYKDSTAYGKYEPNKFLQYVNENDIVIDMQSLCEYVDTNRFDLDIHPTWEKSRDCIYDQYLANYNALPNGQKSTSNALERWAGSSYTSATMIGYSINSTLSLPTTLWLCANFSLMSNISAIDDEPKYIENLKKRWQSTFEDHGAVKARERNIDIIMSSPAFAYQLLEYEQRDLLRVCLLTTVIGFGGLLWLFTLSDIGLTIFGALTIFIIMSVIVCIRLYFHSGTIDLLDFAIMECLMVVLVYFPVYLIEEYMNARAQAEKKEGKLHENALSPALATTNTRSRKALVWPTILMVVAGIGPSTAQIRPIASVGNNLIAIALVSIAMTWIFQPYLLAFSCRTRVCENLCFVEEYDDDEEEQPQPPTTAQNVQPQVQPQTQTVHTEVITQHHDDSHQYPHPHPHYHQHQQLPQHEEVYEDVIDDDMNQDDDPSVISASHVQAVYAIEDDGQSVHSQTQYVDAYPATQFPYSPDQTMSTLSPGTAVEMTVMGNNQSMYNTSMYVPQPPPQLPTQNMAMNTSMYQPVNTPPPRQSFYNAPPPQPQPQQRYPTAQELQQQHQQQMMMRQQSMYNQQTPPPPPVQHNMHTVPSMQPMYMNRQPSMVPVNMTVPTVTAIPVSPNQSMYEASSYNGQPPPPPQQQSMYGAQSFMQPPQQQPMHRAQSGLMLGPPVQYQRHPSMMPPPPQQQQQQQQPYQSNYGQSFYYTNM